MGSPTAKRAVPRPSANSQPTPHLPGRFSRDGAALILTSAVLTGVVPWAREGVTYTYSGKPISIFVGSYQCPPVRRATGSFTGPAPSPVNATTFVEETYQNVVTLFTNGSTTFSPLYTAFYSIYVVTSGEEELVVEALKPGFWGLGTPTARDIYFLNSGVRAEVLRLTDSSQPNADASGRIKKVPLRGSGDLTKWTACALSATGGNRR